MQTFATREYIFFSAGSVSTAVSRKKMNTRSSTSNEPINCGSIINDRMKSNGKLFKLLNVSLPRFTKTI